MRKVVVSEFVSLDGVMEDPGGAEAFEHGGWTRAYWGDEIGKVKYEELFAADALLLGRVTYEGFAKAWPSVKDEQGFADRMNGLPKYVVSQTLGEVAWNNSWLLKGDLAQEVTALKRQEGKDILVFGSAQLVRELHRLELIDEYTLLVYPLTLGSGKQLFGDGIKQSLELIEARPVGAGVVLSRYRPAKGA
jgi:dihydrofolate reductase